MIRNGIRKMTALFLAVALCVSLCTGLTANAGELENGYSQETELSEQAEQEKSGEVSAEELSNPKIEKETSMRAGQKVTWDCIWFGSYPQGEVESSDPVYNELKNFTSMDWESYYETTLDDGNRYRRMKKGTADSDTYHYFKYEPIKWRVLKIDGNKALLLSDVVLDTQEYYTSYYQSIWEKSTIRSWLNGYDASYNQLAQNYSDFSYQNFIDSAFTSGEKLAIVDTDVNADHILNPDIASGDATTDKVFLLSDVEVCGGSAGDYGFVSNANTLDEARRCKSSAYAKAMGLASSTLEDYKGNCSWWLRSPGHDTYYAVTVGYDGYIQSRGESLNNGFGVRVALNLDLSSAQWSYAGTVCSDGTVNEIEASLSNGNGDSNENDEGNGSSGGNGSNENSGGNSTSGGSVSNGNSGGNSTSGGSGSNGNSGGNSSSGGSVSNENSGGNSTSGGSVSNGNSGGNSSSGGSGSNQNSGGNSTSGGSVSNGNSGGNSTSSGSVSNKNSGGNSGKAVKVSKITLSGISKEIAAGKKIKLTAKVTPSNASNKSLTWKSSNKKVATVSSNGVVTLKKNSGGKKVTITATAKDGSKRKATYKITVMKAAVKQIVISGTKTKTLKAGKTLKLKAKVITSNSKKANKKLKWTSSNTKYATVSSTGKVKAKKAGKGKTVKITAMATDGSGKKASVKVKVK